MRKSSDCRIAFFAFIAGVAVQSGRVTVTKATKARGNRAESNMRNIMFDSIIGNDIEMLNNFNRMADRILQEFVNSMLPYLLPIIYTKQ